MTAECENILPLRLRKFKDDEFVTVSICTITFNHAEFIGQAIESFLDQQANFKIEIVIYDDDSSDGTAAIVREYAEAYPSIIKPILSERNLFSLGVNPYYAFVFPVARGEFIAICDGDDYWTEPGKLAKQVEVLRSDPSVAITYGRAFGDLGDGKTIEFSAASNRDLSPMELKTAPAINSATACFRNPSLNKPPQFLRHSPIGDQTVWAIAGELGRGRYIEDLAPIGYRMHSKGVFSLETNKNKFYMSLIAKACIAGYHGNTGDTRAEHPVLSQTVSALTSRLGLGRVIFLALRNGIGQLLAQVQKVCPFFGFVIERFGFSAVPRRPR